MTKVANIKTQVFNFLDVAASLLNPMVFGYFIQPVDDLDGYLAVRRIGDVFLLYRGINVDGGFHGIASVQTHTHLKDRFKSILAYAFSKVHQLGTVARQTLLKLSHATKKLIVRVAFPLHHNLFITEVFQLLEQ